MQSQGSRGPAGVEGRLGATLINREELVAYCPNCSREYAEAVVQCIECGTGLNPGHRPVERYSSIEPQDVLVPLFSFFCFAVSASLLYATIGAQFDWIEGPIATFIDRVQPPCFLIFYLVGTFVSAGVLAGWFLRVFIRRMK